MNQPKAFVMRNPTEMVPGTWQFFLICPEYLGDFVRSLACVQACLQVNSESHLVVINPRWDYQEAWLFIYEQLESESRETELDDVWNIE